MRMSQTKKRKVVDRFQRLLRSGMDYDVRYMYEEAGRSVCITGLSAQRIVNRYYRGVINQEMIDLVNGFVYKNGHLKEEDLTRVSERFNVCKREGRLLIRYVIMKKRKS